MIAPKDWSHKEYSCFDFCAHPVLTFDKFRGSLGTSIFGNSGSATNNTQSRLPSITTFPFLMTMIWTTKIKKSCLTYKSIYMPLIV